MQFWCSVEDYDRAERDAKSRLSNRAIEASSAVTFEHTGYPTRVDTTAALWRYADVMQDGRAKASFDLLGGLTKREFTLLRQITMRAARLTAAHTDKRIVPKDAPLRALMSYRQIAAWKTGAKVFEIGPGSGYLGALLDADGFDYCSTDITQAFHLWQGVLLGKPVQMPWWDWIDIARPDAQVDVIVANHCINEMQIRALQYLIVRAERMLGKSGVLFVEGWGAQFRRSTEQSLGLFGNRGWRVSPRDYYHLLVPPAYDAERAMQASDQPRDVTWSQIEAMWAELGAAEMTPDDEFMKFCGA